MSFQKEKLRKGVALILIY